MLAIDKWASTDPVYQKLHVRDRETIEPKRRALLHLLQDVDSDNTALSRAAADFPAGLQDLREKSIARTILDDLTLRYASEIEVDSTNKKEGSLALAAQNVRAALDAVRKQLETEPIGSVNVALAEARRKLQDYLAAKQTAKAIVPESAVSTREVDLIMPDIPPILPFRETASPLDILRRIAWFDRLTNVAGGVMIVLVGLQTLWVGNLVWGSLTDWITAFLAGASLQFGFGSAISELRTLIRASPS